MRSAIVRRAGFAAAVLGVLALAGPAARAEAIRYAITGLDPAPADIASGYIPSDARAAHIDDAGRITYGPAIDYSGQYRDATYQGPLPPGATPPHGGPPNEIWASVAAGRYEAGSYFDQRSDGFAFVSDGATAKQLPSSYATGITADGRVITTDGGSSSYLYDARDGSVHRLDALPGSRNLAVALGINSAGQIVGWSAAGDDMHAFLTTGGGRPIDLNAVLPPSTGWTLISATGINDAGQVVGYGRDGTGTGRYFLLTPNAVPEPGVLVLAGLVIPAVFVRRLWANKKRIG